MVRAPDGAPVARVMASVEAVLDVRPGLDLARAFAFVDALYADSASRLRHECDTIGGVGVDVADAGPVARLRDALASDLGLNRCR